MTDNQLPPTFHQQHQYVGTQYNAGRDIVIHARTSTQLRHQLRAPINDFVGRTDEIDALVQTLCSGNGAAVIGGVCGMGGIGKTELAYLVAHRVRDHFPDAQIVVPLAGTTTARLTPEQALQAVIRAFTPEAKLPDDLPTLTRDYRACLHDQRVLILADDVYDAAQVRPLHPPAGCALLITSRSYIELEGMQTSILGTLSPAEAEALLLKICPRIRNDAPELAMLCGYLPLALRVSATFLKRRPMRPVAAYLQNLYNEQARLSHLCDPKDPALNVEASLALSYNALPTETQQVFVQLGVFVDSFLLEAAVAVVEGNGSATAEILEELYLNSIVNYDPKTERYELHTLVRNFAINHLRKQGFEYNIKLRYSSYFLSVFQQDITIYGSSEETLRNKVICLLNEDRYQFIAVLRWVLSQIAVSQSYSTRFSMRRARQRHLRYYLRKVLDFLEESEKLEDIEIEKIYPDFGQIQYAISEHLKYFLPTEYMTHFLSISLEQRKIHIEQLLQE